MNPLFPLHYNGFVRLGLKLTRAVTMIFISGVLAFATYTLVRAAPTITATLTDVIIGDDGDGKADPGETIEYTAVITNSGADPATGVTFNDILDLNTTLVAGSINVSPLAGDDAYQTIGNTLLEVGVTASGSPAVIVSGSLFDNDTEFLGDTFTLKSVEADTSAPFTNVSTEQSGLVTVEADGNFSYTPAVGFTGTDNFDYVITDDGPDNIAGNADDLTGAGRVTITVTTQRVWYVNNQAAPGGLGRSSDPFDTLLEAQTASAVNDTIYVFTGNGTTSGQNAGITLKSGQRLLGNGVALTVPVSVNGGPNPTTLRVAGTHPLIAHSAGNGVSVTTASADASNVEIRGLNIAGGGAGNNAIDFTTSSTFGGSVEIANNIISAAPLEGVDINGGGSGTLTVSIHDNTVTATGNGIDIVRTAGNLNITAFDDNNVNGATGGIGINIVGTGASILFDANPGTASFDTVSGGGTAIGQSGNGVGTSGLVLSNIRGDLNFTDLDIFSDNGAALFVNGTSPNYTGTSGMRVTVTASVSTISATSGAAADITDANVNLVLTSLSSANSTGSGIALTRVSGTFTGPLGSTITNASNADVSINGGSNGSANVAFTYGGTITDDLGTLVQIQNVTASSTHSFTGAITDGNDGDGSGISLTGNSGATITFSGGLLVSTGANPAFAASGGGTVNVCDENPCNPAATGALVNTLTSTTGTALNVNGTTIGANNLEFRSI
ncbi:MAG TPA: Ig-like domain-containing protein, partial [Anaerolineales bacterium]|nr:Ig-like domain-containing protein [Anaerolineales bacterium]